MEYEKRIVCYLDILGFADLVEKKIISAEKINLLFKEIGIIISNYKEEHIQILHFSDSIAISIKRTTLSNTQLNFIVDVLIKLLEHNLVARGSMVYGEIIHTSDNIYGPGFVKAVYLEKKLAKFPRIILDESLYNHQLPTIGNAKINFIDFFNDFKFVKKDTIDNYHYIDYLGVLIDKENVVAKENLLKLIEFGLKCKSIFEKYNWIKGKLDNIKISGIETNKIEIK